MSGGSSTWSSDFTVAVAPSASLETFFRVACITWPKRSSCLVCGSPGAWKVAYATAAWPFSSWLLPCLTRGPSPFLAPGTVVSVSSVMPPVVSTRFSRYGVSSRQLALMSAPKRVFRASLVGSMPWSLTDLASVVDPPSSVETARLFGSRTVVPLWVLSLSTRSAVELLPLGSFRCTTSTSRFCPAPPASVPAPDPERPGSLPAHQR